MTDRPGVVVLAVSAVVHDRLGRLLLIRRGTEPDRGLWALPGGRVELGETMREAVVREVAEETGLRVVCEGFVDWVERISTDHHFVIASFGATLVDQPDATTTPDSASDADAASWVASWDVPDLALVDGLLEFLSDHDLVSIIV